MTWHEDRDRLLHSRINELDLRIEGSELIPMRSVPQSLDSLAAEEAPLIVFCHHGMRSLQVVSWLREQGIERSSSMEGGIDRWSLEIDPTVPRYV